MWLETANSYVSAHWLNISQLPNIGALANTLPLVLEQPASGKQPAGLILYFQLHNLLVAQTGWLAGYRPSGVFLQAANIGQVARHGIGSSWDYILPRTRAGHLRRYLGQPMPL